MGRLYASLSWSVEDIRDHVDTKVDDEHLTVWLERNGKHLQERLCEKGHEVIKDLLAYDPPDAEPVEPAQERDWRKAVDILIAQMKMGNPAGTVCESLTRAGFEDLADQIRTPKHLLGVDPIACPFCKSPNIVVGINTHVLADTEGTRLDEHQCLTCSGRPFFT